MNGDRPVDSTTAVSTGERSASTALSTDAGEAAFRKYPHQGPAGSFQVRYVGGGYCGGKLLTAYVRVKGERYGEATRWTPIGVVCMGCQVYWPRAAPA